MVKFGVRFEEGSASRHWQSSHVAYGALKKVLKRASQASGRPVGRSTTARPEEAYLIWRKSDDRLIPSWSEG